MLRNVKDLRGYALRATDGVIGKVDDLYFDEEEWGIRYLVVDTGGWLSGRKVLISPIALGHARFSGGELQTSAHVNHGSLMAIGRSISLAIRKASRTN